MTDPGCAHDKVVTTDMRKHGVPAQITVCVACGQSLDYRPLPGASISIGAKSLPEEEAMIQARAKIAKAEELGIAGEIREESGITGALPEDPPEGPQEGPEGTHEEVGTGPPASRSRADGSPVLCEKHGGEIGPCDTGERRAHNCHHSKWGKLRTFDGPCACLECHKEQDSLS